MTVKSGDESQEDQRMCVVCSRTSPKTIFSCRYKVHERNIEVLQKFFIEKKTLKFGELCDRCYRLWYKHKRQKQKPGASTSSRSTVTRTKGSKESNNGAKEEEIVAPQPPIMSTSAKKTRSRSLKPQKTRVLRSNARQQSPFKSGSTSSSPVDDDNEHYEYDVEEDFSEAESYRQNAGFSQIIVALCAMSKPPRKSKRKNTPVRSAAKLDPVHEYILSRNMLLGSSHEDADFFGTSSRSEVDGAAKVLSNASSPSKGESHDMDDDEEEEDDDDQNDEDNNQDEDIEPTMQDEESMHEISQEAASVLRSAAMGTTRI